MAAIPKIVIPSATCPSAPARRPSVVVERGQLALVERRQQLGGRDAARGVEAHVERAAGPDAEPALTAALRDSSPDVVLAAIESLGEFDDASVAKPLSELSDHPDMRVREAAGKLARRP